MEFRKHPTWTGLSNIALHLGIAILLNSIFTDIVSIHLDNSLVWLVLLFPSYEWECLRLQIEVVL